MKLPELVMPDSPSVSVISKLERRRQREFGGHRIAWEEAWLWTPEEGYALFAHQVRLPPAATTWGLERVWLRRELRRKGLVSAAWTLWRNRYGKFEVIEPNLDVRSSFRAIEAPNG